MDDMVFSVVFEAIMLGMGVYLLYLGIQMKRTGEVPDVLLAEQDRNRITDRRGFSADMAPWVISFAVSSLVLSLEGALNVTGVLSFMWKRGEKILDTICVIAFLACFILFTMKLRNCRNKYISQM